MSSVQDDESGHGHGHGGHGHGAPEARREAPADLHGGHGGHGHAHGHGGHGAASSSSALTWALALTASFMMLEAAAGIWTHGLALLADAGHMLADAASLGLALVAAEWAKRPRTAKSTFGHRRAEVLAAFVNGIALAVTAIAVVVEAVERWQSPQEIRAGAMLLVASAGLAMNGVVALILARSGGNNANMRAAIAHVLTDALGSVGAMSAAALILFCGWHRADAVVSVLIAVLVAFSGWRVIRETTSILLEAAPGHIDVVEVEKMIKGCPGVGGVHDLHVWRISDEFDALTVHVTLGSGVHGVDVCRDVARKLETTFGIAHVTVQPEAPPPTEVVRIRAGKDGRLLNSP